MGKQSARLYFQGKDHKDIYFNGHYHDAVYLTDGEGNATLVWEKIKGILDTKTFFLTYMDGLYIAIISNVYAKDITFYSGNDRYGMNPCNVRDIRREDRRVQSMFGLGDKLEAILKLPYSVRSYSIPVSDGKLDTDNAVSDRLDGYYWNTSRSLVGNNCNIYEASLYSPSTSVASAPGIIIDGRAVNYDSPELNGSAGIFGLAGKLFADSVLPNDGIDMNVPLRFFELDDSGTGLVSREVRLPVSLTGEFKLRALRAYNEKNPSGTKDEWSYKYTVPYETNHSGSVSVVNSTKGAVYLHLIAENGNKLWGKVFRYDEIYKAIIDFTRFEITGYTKVEETALYTAQGFGKNWRVQFTFRRKGGGASGNYYLSYGRVSDMDDSYIGLSEISGMQAGEMSRYYNGEITCIAETGNILYVGTRDGSGYVNKHYIRIDTMQNKAELTEYYIGIKK